MARQKGIIPLKGTIGNITFYKTKNGYLAREKGGIDAARIATDPAFQRTRENGAEFARAGVAGKLLRTSIRTLLQTAQDSNMTGRLTRQFMKVIKADSTSVRGMRNVIDGEAELLEGFEFNEGSKLGTTLFAPTVIGINRVTGELSVSIDPFIPKDMIAAPNGATHFKIISGGSEIDFENEVYTSNTQNTGTLPWDGTATAAINLVNTVTANSTHPLFLALGIEFYQQVNNAMYSLNNGAFNSLGLVKVSGAPV